MHRRAFLSTIAGSLLAAPVDALTAQPRVKVPRVGYLTVGSQSDQGRQRRFEAFRQDLRELGYVEGQNIAIESRWAEGQDDQYPTLAADLVRLKVDVIVTVGGAATKAAQQATRTLPTCFDALRPTWTRSSRARSPVTCPSSSPRNLSSSST